MVVNGTLVISISLSGQPAFQRGRAAVVVPLQLAMANCIIVLAGVMVFAEHITLLRGTGIMLIVVGTALLQFKPSSDSPNANEFESHFRWILEVFDSIFICVRGFKKKGLIHSTFKRFHVFEPHPLVRENKSQGSCRRNLSIKEIPARFFKPTVAP